MPDVIIKGMEMPGNCAKCRLQSYRYCFALPVDELQPSSCLDRKRPDWCPLAPANGWIPADKPPEPYTKVLLYYERDAWKGDKMTRKREIGIGCCDANYEIWNVDGCSGVVGIAWMPLPEVPE